jgi:hypothetical protein
MLAVGVVSALALAALAVAQGELAKGVRGGRPGWGRFRGLEVDAYQRGVGLALSPDPSVEGHPWCAAAVYACFERGIDDAGTEVGAARAPNPCPRTAGALHMWDTSPLTARTQIPEVGAVFVLDHGKGKGHVGFVSAVSHDGLTITTVEPDTNAAGSTAGDAWGEKMWRPSDGARGRLVGYLAF